MKHLKNCQNQLLWDASYSRGDNFVFQPHEEVVRFISRNIRKRVGIQQFEDIASNIESARVLDLGCGIGRHVHYCQDMGLQAWGIDLSAAAIEMAKKIQVARNNGDPSIFIQGDVQSLPWEDGVFRYVVSHGVLDSMPFVVAQKACRELSRVMEVGGLFYCDLISGDDSEHGREYSGESFVESKHEQGTVQSYFNYKKITDLVGTNFKIKDCQLIRREDVLLGGYKSRYHLILERSEF